VWALYCAFTRHFDSGINGVPLFLVATAGVLWLAYLFSDQATLVFNMGGLLQVFVMGVMMATAYSCCNHSIQHGNLAILATMSYFTPVSQSCWQACGWVSIHTQVLCME